MTEATKNIRTLADIEADLQTKGLLVATAGLARINVLEQLIADTASNVLDPNAKFGKDSMARHLATVFTTAAGEGETLDTKANDFRRVIEAAAVHGDDMKMFQVKVREARDAVVKNGGKAHDNYRCLVACCREYTKVEKGKSVTTDKLMAACLRSKGNATSTDDAARLIHAHDTLQVLVNGQEAKNGKKARDQAFTGEPKLRAALEAAFKAVAKARALLPVDFSALKPKDIAELRGDALKAYVDWQEEQDAKKRATSKSASARAARQKNGGPAEAFTAYTAAKAKVEATA